MSDLNMISIELPEAFFDAVRSYQARSSKNRSKKPNFFDRVSQWICPTIGYQSDEDSVRPRKPKDTDATSCTPKPSLDRDSSTKTLETVVSSLSDDWDDNISDSTDGNSESLNGGQEYDGWLSRTTLQDESDYDEETQGEYYFTPSQSDFPRMAPSINPPKCTAVKTEARPLLPSHSVLHPPGASPNNANLRREPSHRNTTTSSIPEVGYMCQWTERFSFL